MKYFLDCEFNGYRGELISLALASEDGRYEYLINQKFWKRHEPDVDSWVLANVIPVLVCEGAITATAVLGDFGEILAEFFADDPLPTIIADWPDDIRYFCECLITGPGEMINIPSADAASPYNRTIQFVVERVDAYPTDLPGAVQHNALWDARALRHKLMKNA